MKNLLFFIYLLVAQLCLAQSPGKQQSNPYQKDIPKLMTIPNAVDSNQDGELSFDEVMAAPQQLVKLDKNGDGSIDAGEMGAPEKQLSFVRNHNITNLIDANGDVHISAAEIKEASTSLQYLDRNKDWHISKKELALSKMARFPIFSSRGMRMPLWEHFRGYTATNEGPIPIGKDDRAFKGYFLIHEAGDNGLVQMSNKTYLLNEKGEKVHEWKYEKGQYSPETTVAYLLPNGQLLRTISKHNWTKDKDFPVGAYSSIQLVDWEGKEVWSYTNSVPKKYSFHHDVEYLPNGNILAIRYNGFTIAEAVAMGWDSSLALKGPFKTYEDEGILWMSGLVELKPNLEDGSTEIVWQWNPWDHYVQHKYPNKPNYGEITDPSKIHVNYLNLDKDAPGNIGQFFHMNAVTYHPKLDLVMVSCATYGEFWIIDHSTTMEEAAGSKGGKYKQGGDLLYRWGNPHALGKGTKDDQVLYFQHNTHWIEEGKPGAGNVLLFNNGGRRTLDGTYRKKHKPMPFGDAYTDILEVQIPMDENGQFNRNKEAKVVWSWNEKNTEDYFSPFMSGATRLPNGNTIFCRSYDKYLIEVTPEGEKVLEVSIASWGRLYRIYKYGADYSGLKFKE